MYFMQQCALRHSETIFLFEVLELKPGHQYETISECMFFLGMVVHGSKASLRRRRLGMTAQFTRTNVRMNRMTYTQSRAFTEDFRKPVLVAGQDDFGVLRYHKNKEQIPKGNVVVSQIRSISQISNSVLIFKDITMKLS